MHLLSTKLPEGERYIIVITGDDEMPEVEGYVLDDYSDEDDLIFDLQGLEASLGSVTPDMSNYFDPFNIFSSNEVKENAIWYKNLLEEDGYSVEILFDLSDPIFFSTEEKFWSAFGHLEAPVAPMDYDDIIGSESFSEDEIDELISSGLVNEKESK